MHSRWINHAQALPAPRLLYAYMNFVKVFWRKFAWVVYQSTINVTLTCDCRYITIARQYSVHSVGVLSMKSISKLTLISIMCLSLAIAALGVLPSLAQDTSTQTADNSTIVTGAVSFGADGSITV